MAALLQSAHTMWLAWERHDPGAEEKVVQPFAAQFFRRRDGAGATQDDVKFVQLLLRLRASVRCAGIVDGRPRLRHTARRYGLALLPPRAVCAVFEEIAARIQHGHCWCCGCD